MEALPHIADVTTLAAGMNRPCLLPVATTIDGCQDPAHYYLSLRRDYEFSYLLESFPGTPQNSRYSAIGCEPLLRLRVQNGFVEIDGSPEIVQVAKRRLARTPPRTEALELLQKAMLFDRMRVLGLNLPRYMIGVTGYLSYDFVRSIIPIRSCTHDDLQHPTLEFILPGLVILFDHLERRTYYASLILLSKRADIQKDYRESLERLEELLSIETHVESETRKRIHVTSNIEKEQFERKVESIKRYILAGDVIQAVLSRRIDLDPAPDLSTFYLHLRRINPSPYMFFLDFSGRAIIGSSPEALVRVQGTKVLTRPIAGTRPRGSNRSEDTAMEQDLIRDQKERAEHVMLVDLARNDIGKVSKFGTVKTPELMEIEKYGDVQHIVSTVVGELREDRNAFDALRAVFPAGTVTGAPKVRSMEIIEELEPTRRGIYAGAVGTFSYNGDADLAIAIRTLTSQNGRAQIQVGAGIVADSEPWKEHYETHNKARSLLKASGV